jgi:hypothetical protein
LQLFSGDSGCKNNERAKNMTLYVFLFFFCFFLNFSFNLNEFNFDITMQSLLGINKFGAGVTAWLINNVHVVVEGL